MNELKKLYSGLKKNQIRIFSTILNRWGWWLPDKLWLSLRYRLTYNKKLDWKSPKTFTEKLQWLKVYDRKSEYVIMADKVKAKEWVAKRIGNQYIIPTLGVWERAEEIDFDQLPNRFVLKCNHNSGMGMYICKDKSMMDKVSVIRNLKRGMKENYYFHAREWPYKNIPRRILAEQFMEDFGNSISINDFQVYQTDIVHNSKPLTPNDYLTDYKFFCFDGEPFMMYVSQDYAKNTSTDFFDMDYNHLPITMKDLNSENPPSKPAEFEEMKALARKLSKGTSHLRVDFYVVNHRIYFGELTFFHNAGFGPVNPPEWNSKLGTMITLYRH